jgi:uncharacterized protein YmfQ (DUF2313 family)
MYRWEFAMPLDPLDTTDAATLARLRRFIAEPDDAGGYTDQVLSDMYDAAGADVNITAADVWREKAGKAADLVDVSEGSSSRKMSQVAANALKQAEFYDPVVSADSLPIVRGAKTRPIVRV